MERQLGPCVRLQTESPDLLREVVSLVLHRTNFDVELCYTIFMLHGGDIHLQLFDAVLFPLYIRNNIQQVTVQQLGCLQFSL